MIILNEDNHSKILSIVSSGWHACIAFKFSLNWIEFSPKMCRRIPASGKIQAKFFLTPSPNTWSSNTPLHIALLMIQCMLGYDSMCDEKNQCNLSHGMSLIYCQRRLIVAQIYLPIVGSYSSTKLKGKFDSNHNYLHLGVTSKGAMGT